MRSAVVGFLILLASAAPASAVPFGKRSFLPSPERQVATCLRATGEPGGLARLGLLTRRDSAVDLLRGTEVTDSVRLGALADCPAVAEAGGAAVVAGPAFRGRPGRARAAMRVAVREPGGGFSAPVTAGSDRSGNAGRAAAINARGDAVVAWTQARYVGSPPDQTGRIRVVAVRRTAGGRFGAIELLTPWRAAGRFAKGSVAAAIDPAGRVTIAWARSVTAGTDAAAVEAAAAGPGAEFAAAQVLVRQAEQVDGPELAVAPDGAALLAFTGDELTWAFDRAPGAGGFARGGDLLARARPAR